MTVRLHNNQKVYTAILALLIVVPVLLSWHFVYAVDLKNRYLRVATSKPSAVTKHTVGFDIVTGGTLGSIQLEYCENSPLFSEACTPPIGLSASTATVSSQTGVTGFTVHGSSTVNKIILTKSPEPVTPQSVKYELDSIQNHSAPSTTVYMRISTYASDDATGPSIDTGAVAYATNAGLGAKLFVPPYLSFCVAVTVAPDCSTATGSSLDIGEMSPTSTKAVTSQFSAATNDVNGYVTTAQGITMTSGNNIISPLSVPSSSKVGTSQYGINLRANSSPAVGQNPLGAGSASPAPEYNAPDKFTFKNGTVASSPISTDYNTFTVSYIVNIPADQPAGIYSTTMTYITTAQF